MFAENLVGLGFLKSVSYINQSQPTKNCLPWEKVAQMPLLTYFFPGWIGRRFGGFVGFIIILPCFPTQHHLVNRKHPTRKSFVNAESSAGDSEVSPMVSASKRHPFASDLEPSTFVINTSYQKLPFGSGDYPDKLLFHRALN